MGVPIFSPSKIPFLINTEKLHYSLFIQNKSYSISVVSLGNPHCVIKVDDINTAPVYEVGKQLSQHFLFPVGVNVSFMQIISCNKVLLRVYERHVGETQACGSGACAAVSVGIRNKELCNDVSVKLLQGKLKISWDGDLKNTLYMSGEAMHVYDGVIKY